MAETNVRTVDHEANADALELAMSQRLDAAVSLRRKDGKPFPTKQQLDDLIETRTFRRGSGTLFVIPRTNKAPDEDLSGRTVKRLKPMSKAPTFREFFEKRFAPGAHLLQSAALAKRKGCPEETILGCLLHDLGNYIMRCDHGYWAAQMIEPYVSEKVAFAVRYHQALRFFPDPETNYEYPIAYYQTFGIDYVPAPHIVEAYKYVVKHPWYEHARLVTTNDLYAFDPNAKVEYDEFEDIVGRHFKQPTEGLGNDNSPVAHMWRSLANPDAPL